MKIYATFSMSDFVGEDAWVHAIIDDICRDTWIRIIDEFVDDEGTSCYRFNIYFSAFDYDDAESDVRLNKVYTRPVDIVSIWYPLDVMTTDELSYHNRNKRISEGLT